ncbi:MAG TPA: universal stress protein [Gemmatimonadales bacterium]|nr:universal stress protein [Gemmatimonadales bacterium]
MSTVATPMLKRIAIGVDFAEPSRAAAAWVARSLAPDAELLLVNAVDNAVPHEMVAFTEPDEERLTAMMQLAEERLSALALDLPVASVSVRTGSDRPAWVIGQAAEQWGADLIVIGPHGSAQPEWKRLGSTAERLVRVSPIPVLTVPIPPAYRPRRILAPVDQVELTPEVLAWASLMAERCGGTVTLLHAMEPGESNSESDVSGWLRSLAQELPEGAAAEPMVEQGASGSVVVKVASRMGADLIVMGRRGRGRGLPAVLGSTVSDVLRSNLCPVLVVTDPSDTVLEGWDGVDG